MTLIGTTPLTRYPRLHPDMGYLRTIMSPAPTPMTLNDLLISQFPSHDQRSARPKTSGAGILGEQLPVVSALAALFVLAHACDLTNATLPLGQFPESQRLNVLRETTCLCTLWCLPRLSDQY